MACSYNKLWKLLINKGMTKTELSLQTDMSTAMLAKMSKNEVVSLLCCESVRLAELWL